MRGRDWHMAIFILIYFSLYCCDFLISWCSHPPSNLSRPPNPKMMSTELLITLELESEWPISHFKRFSDLPVVFGAGEENYWYITVASCHRAAQRAPWSKGSRTLAAERRGMEKCQWADSWEKLQEMAKCIHAALVGPRREGQTPGNVAQNHPGRAAEEPQPIPLWEWTKYQLLQPSWGAGIVQVFIWVP